MNELEQIKSYLLHYSEALKNKDFMKAQLYLEKCIRFSKSNNFNVLAKFCEQFLTKLKSNPLDLEDFSEELFEDDMISKTGVNILEEVNHFRKIINNIEKNIENYQLDDLKAICNAILDLFKKAFNKGFLDKFNLENYENKISSILRNRELLGSHDSPINAIGPRIIDSELYKIPLNIDIQKGVGQAFSGFGDVSEQEKEFIDFLDRAKKELF